MVQTDRLTDGLPKPGQMQTKFLPKPRLLMICGPTASGKTGLSLALAKRLNGEIFSADSIQIYRGLDIGSAKPTPEEQSLAPHHLIDIVDPDGKYSVAQYKEDFERAVSALGAGRIPIVCGGTGLYYNALLFEYDFAGAVGNAELRRTLTERAETEGRDVLFAELRSCDPETAEKLSPNDLKRVIRALEIFQLTGKKKSEIRPKLTDHYDFSLIGLQMDRELLYKRIDERVLCMFRDGLVEEVSGLLERGIDESCQSMQAIGYKETLRHVRGLQTLEETIEEIQRATRNYAKRQITWFKRVPGIRWLDAEDAKLADRAAEIYLNDIKKQ